MILLLFVAVGIPGPGTTLGPNMIISWYADLGKALPAGSDLPAVQNTVYFNGNAITTPLLVLSACALASTIALLIVAILHPPLPGQRAQQPGQPTGATARSQDGPPCECSVLTLRWPSARPRPARPACATATMGNRVEAKAEGSPSFG